LLASLADAEGMLELVGTYAPKGLVSSRIAMGSLTYACDVVVALPEDDAVRVLGVMIDATLGQKQWDETEMHKLAVALTSMLRDPPWRRRAARPVLALETLPYPETITWGEGEREKLLEMPAVQHGNAQIRPMTKEELIEFDALPDLQKYVDAWPRWQSKQWL